MPRLPQPRSLATLELCAVLFLLLTAPLLAQRRQALQTKAAAPAGARLIGPMPASQQLSLALTLPLRNPDQLNALLQQLENPASPSYHQYLTAAQFTEQFGPTVAQYQQVIGFAQSHGFTVTHTSPSRRLLNLTGSVAKIEQAFQVTMQVYQHPTENRTFYAPDVAPTVEAGYPVLGVSGLTNFELPHPMLAHAASDGSVHSNQTGSGPGGQFLGSDFRTAYYGAGPLTGSGQALALAEFGTWNMLDVQNYFSPTGANQTLTVPIVTEFLGGTNGACPEPCDDGEEANDIIQIVSMAPAASVLIVYTDTSGNADIDIFDQYSQENIAKAMSMSFGIGQGNAVTDESYFQTFHAQGQNFFIASGDEGANLGDGGWPGYSQNVTDVGGTTLTTGTGQAWLSEVGWVGSGTGWCDSSNSSTPCFGSPYNTIDEIPSYQSSPASMLSTITAAGGSSKYRNLPDVSADANTDSFWCAGGTCQGGLGGTSLAAPRWAGFVALANEQAALNGETIGFLNPTIYALGQTSGYDAAFHDITSGCNPSGSTVPAGFTGQFCAMTGFDMVTGWGTPNGPGMIDALAPTSTTNPFFTLTALPSTIPLTPGGAPGTSTISLTPGNGFSGTADLTATILGAPTGVTASFSPTSITGGAGSTLTVSTTSSSPGGNLILVVTGTSGSLVQTAYVTLALPDFALAAAPTGIYLNQGASAPSTITVSSENGFSGSVTFSPVGGLPGGVTGSFNPTTTSSTSTLTLTASSTASTGSGAALTITGTSGGITQTLDSMTLAVSAATGTTGSGTPVSLSSAYNLPGLYNDGITFGTGLDGAGFGYSSTLLTGNRILNGVQFNFGPANTKNCTTSCINDTVYGTGSAIPLPSGQFTALQLLATGIDGPILSQTITVTYTDSTTSTFTQSFSDWCSCSSSTPGPGQQPGESFAVVMPYRDEATGGQDDRPFNLYAYTFVLNSSKTVQSLTLPNNRDVVVLAATLTTQSLGTQVSLASQYNTAGLFNNGITFPANGGMDGGGNSCTLPSGCADGYSAQQLGLPSTTPPSLTIKGLQFTFGPVNTKDCTTACTVDMINLNPGVTVTLPSNQQTAYTTMTMLGTGVQLSHTGTVTVTYTTGVPTVFNQTFSDWCNYQDASGNETIAVGGMYRINSDGTLQMNTTCNLYAYTYALDSSRIVQSIALANADSTNFSLALALTLSGNTSATPGYTLSAAPSTLSVAQGASNTSTITISPTGGFTGSVSLAASGLPSGVTALFNPTTISNASPTSTLTLTASGTAAVGEATVTVTGTTATLGPQTTAIALTVTPPPNFTLSADPTSLSIPQGGNGASTITVNPTNGFTGTVALAVTSTLPPGVSALLNPTSATSTTPSTLSVIVSSSVPPGPLAVTVTGTSGTLAPETATVNLTVTVPGFTLAAAPSTLSVAQSGNNTSTITVTPTGGFTGSVSLAATGLPSGVTAAFNPASTATTSVLTLTASSSASTGPTTVTVTGTSGALAQTATIAVTVTPPASYSLSAPSTGNPSTVAPGGTSTAAVTVTSANSYTGSVTLLCTVTSTVTFTPSQATCSFGNTSPVAVTTSGGTGTVTFSTVSSSAMMLRRSNGFYALWLPLPGLALIGLAGSRGSRRKKLLGLLLLWIVLAALIILPACASGSSGGGGGGSSGTPAGTYTLTITGKDANELTQSNTAPAVSVTVN
jgi:hypothetical protein